MLFDPNRGRLVPPNLDDRTWADLVKDATTLIQQYAPQWTNQGPGDLGMTLVELFAWLVEGLTYRLNQVPDKNYVAFLDLLGITRLPPNPARSFLTFSAAQAPVVVPKGTQAQTAATETQPAIVFETDDDVRVLPINLQAVLQIDKVPNAVNKYANLAKFLAQTPAPGGTVTIPANQAVQICLGFDAASIETLNLMVRLFAPLPAAGVTVTWVYSKAASEPSAWTAITLAAGADGTAGLTQDGVVAITVPTDWAKQDPPHWSSVAPATVGDTVSASYYWLGLRVTNLTAKPLAFGLSWILFNSVSSYSALTIRAPEPLGNGTGMPFQNCTLANGPLFAAPGSSTPYSHLVVQVAGEEWTQADEIPAGPGQYYQVDPVQSQITFGNYDPLNDTGHGTMPGTLEAIVATTYRYVDSGAAANVTFGKVAAMRSLVTGITAVTNLFAAYGGSDQQPIEDAKRRAPDLLRNRNRAVTGDDYQFLAVQASTEVAAAYCLAPNVPSNSTTAPPQYGGLDRSPGNVNVVIVPAIGPELTATPQPTTELVQAVQSFLDGRRHVTAKLAVKGPSYLAINISVTASAWQKAIGSGLATSASDLQNYVQSYILDKATRFLHPVVGGINSTGWRVGESLYLGDLYKAIMPPENLGFISQLLILPGTPLYPGGRPPDIQVPPAAGAAWIELADYELICPGTISVGTPTVVL